MSRVAIVTGGTRGIGRAICEQLRSDGFTVAANYGGNDEAARNFTAETGIKTYKWDVGDHEASLAGCATVACKRWHPSVWAVCPCRAKARPLPQPQKH